MIEIDRYLTDSGELNELLLTAIVSIEQNRNLDKID